MKNKYKVIAVSCLFFAVAGVCYSCSYGKDYGQSAGKSHEQSDANHEQDIVLLPRESTGDQKVSVDGQDTEDSDKPFIYIHLCGAVVNPDVYRIEAGARLVDLIEFAGGLLPEAAGDYMNQAMEVEDGQRIYIPTITELEELTISEYAAGGQESGEDNSSSEADNKVNINTADETKLMSLPGIGQAKAKSIIDYRNKNGSFKATEDLMNIPGIKEGLFSKIEDLITVK